MQWGCGERAAIQVEFYLRESRMVLMSAILGGIVAGLVYIPANIIAKKRREEGSHNKPVWPSALAVLASASVVVLAHFLMLR